MHVLVFILRFILNLVTQEDDLRTKNGEANLCYLTRYIVETCWKREWRYGSRSFWNRVRNWIKYSPPSTNNIAKTIRWSIFQLFFDHGFTPLLISATTMYAFKTSYHVFCELISWSIQGRRDCQSSPNDSAEIAGFVSDTIYKYIL